MKLSDLSTETLEKIKPLRWDRIIEKHEGPETWEYVLESEAPEFLEIARHPVLLPIEQSRHPNITILRSIWSADINSVTIFLKDTTYDDDPFSSGFMAVCDRLKDEDFFVAILYHEWFIIEREADVFA
ncbi:hypothetical protein [Nodularia sphaerocarpa]|uniref:hypothetical protein n=1 Tax=Nodularia sphaerocarpa TaxID=137816 RepID=UPI002330ED59|nr:hypothetical protein [Nodularia sphaerocarpa]MDB9372315.1 hypothetical protein [Nodularia sphaerocarpa CS-585]MDB9377931.1 hypothetical protein [Nodularia sphaerocarpa CS-585A2]